MKNEMLIEFCKPKLIEKFGKNTSLAKHELSPSDKCRAKKFNGENPTWSILSLGDQAFAHKIHGSGKTPESALKAAGLESFIDDAKKWYKQLSEKPTKLTR